MTTIVRDLQAAQPESPSPRQVPEWLYRLAVMAIASSLTLPALIRTTRFFYIDDTQSQGLPSMALVGRALRAGEWKTLYSDLGPGGNLATDPQYGMFFPPKLLLSVLVSLFDDVRLAGTLTTAAFLGVLALGMVSALRSSQVQRSWAAAGAISVSTTGFLFFWASTAWHPALWAYSLIPWLWWSLVQRGGITRVIGVFVVSWCLVGFAFPSAAVAGALLLCVWAVVHLATERGFLRVGYAAASFAAGCVLGALNYLPLFLSAATTTRYGGLRNDDFLVPNLGDLLASWSPTATAELVFWGGPVTHSPVFYLGWFALPLLPVIRWRRQILSSPRVQEMTLYVALCLLLTQMPSEVGPFRWPFRFLPAVAIAATALFCLSASTLGFRLTRTRLLGSAALLLTGAWIQFGRTPQDLGKILAAALIVAALVAATAVAVDRGRSPGWIALGGAYLTAVVAVFALPGPGTNPDVPDFGYANRVSDIPVSPVPADTRALLLRTGESGDSDYRTGAAVGFVPTYHDRFLGQSYAAVGQKYLAQALCADYLGRVCPESVSFLTSREENTGLLWRDLLGYSHFLIEDRLASDSLLESLSVIDKSGTYTHLRSSRQLPAPHVTYASTGVDSIRSTGEGVDSLTFEVRTSAPSTLVFDQTWWPGWEATLDGQPLEVSNIDEILLAVRLPAGSEGELRIEYQPLPAEFITAATLLSGLLLLLAAVPALLERRSRA